MESAQHNVPSESAKIEQIITEFFAKSLHIILEARSPCNSSRSFNSGESSSGLSACSSSPSSSVRPRDKWFNLALRECPAAVENMDWWRQSNLELLVVDVILVRRQLDLQLADRPSGGCLLRNLSAKEHYPTCWSPGEDEQSPKPNREKIVERWIIQYERGKNSNSNRENKKCSSRSSSSSDLASYKKTYKRSILLMRSLYATVRLLPSYKVFRDLNSSGQIHPISLTHKISSFVEPFTRSEDAEMNQFSFVPVDTPGGRLCLSVSYLPLLEDVSSEPSTPLSTQFIPDYVGSPLADPLKRFQSLPNSGSTPVHLPFTRRHSWSYDNGATPLISCTRSPTYSDSRALQNQHHGPPQLDANVDVSPRNLANEYWPSPPLSPSYTPSPPTDKRTAKPLKISLRTESCPVGITCAGKSSGLHNQLPPTPSPRSLRPKCASQPETAKPQLLVKSSSLGSTQNKQENIILGGLQSEKDSNKALSLGKELKNDVGCFHGTKMPSCCSPQVLFSRSSSRFSSLDDYNDPEFDCPFAVGFDDIRTESNAEKANENDTSDPGKLPLVLRSQDAAIGALVHMLKSAPPLCQDFSNLANNPQLSACGDRNQMVESNKRLELTTGSITSSALLRSRTTANALEELRSYGEIKDLILSQGGTNSLVAKHAGESKDGGQLKFK